MVFIRILTRIAEDVQTAFEKDPAAKSVLEVLTCYPGLHAVWMHRVSHWLWEHDVRWFARFLSHLSRFFTGVEIHPGAEIGRRFFIDHGGGVVIGETAEIGDDVLMYQGCTLGGTSSDPVKRHPTLEDNVVVGAGSILLGPITVGENAKVGAGSVVLDSVESGSTVVGVPASPAGETEPDEFEQLRHGEIPDPIEGDLDELRAEQEALEARIEALEARLDELRERRASTE